MAPGPSASPLQRPAEGSAGSPAPAGYGRACDRKRNTETCSAVSVFRNAVLLQHSVSEAPEKPRASCVTLPPQEPGLRAGTPELTPELGLDPLTPVRPCPASGSRV